MSQVASRLALLPWTLPLRFSTEVRITPKRFARVHRLQRVLRAVRRSSESDWCVLAAQLGYTIKRIRSVIFGDLADIAPSGYKPLSPQRNNHVPILARRRFFTIQADAGFSIVDG